MKAPARATAFASILGLGACTTLLGVDGDYDAGSGGAAASGGTTASAGTVVTAAESVASSGAGGAGGTSPATTGGGDGGAGGQGPAECPLCRIETIGFEEPEGRRPRIAHLAPELRFTYLHDERIETRGPAFADGELAPEVVDALLVSGGGELRLVWMRNAGRNAWELMENGDPLVGGATTQPTFDAVITSEGLLIATFARDEKGNAKPVLFLCDDASGCTANLVCPGIEKVGARKAALTRRDDALAFARMCQGQLRITDRTDTPLLEPQLSSLGVEELAVTYAQGQVVALTITAPRTADAEVQMHFLAGSGPRISIPGAHSPALVATDDTALAVLASGPGEEMVAIHCDGLNHESCDVVSLTGAPLEGGDSPSLGLVGSPPTEVWLGWEQDGIVQVGRLGP